jgi:hypothetical protein
MNKSSGTYWCNHCEDNAFSEICWRCHREATFIPSTTGTMATAPAPASAIVRYVTPPAEWFRRMRDAINT